MINSLGDNFRDCPWCLAVKLSIGYNSLVPQIPGETVLGADFFGPNTFSEGTWSTGDTKLSTISVPRCYQRQGPPPGRVHILSGESISKWRLIGFGYSKIFKKVAKMI